MKFLTIVIFLLLLLPLAIFVYVWYRFHVKLNLHADSSGEKIPANWKTETQFVTNQDNQKIAYWYFPVENSKAVVILVHGYSNPGGKAQMLGYAEYLHDAGYSTALLDLRSFGESEGNKITLAVNEWKDVVAVFDQLKSLPENRNQKIGFLGVSMGAVTSLMTVGQTQKGDFVIAAVPYADFESLFHSQIQAAGLPPTIFYPFMRVTSWIELGINYEKFAPTKIIKNIKVPIFFIAATQDEKLNSQDVKNLYYLAQEPKEYWAVDSRHNVFGQHPNEFKEKVFVVFTKTC